MLKGFRFYSFSLSYFISCVSIRTSDQTLDYTHQYHHLLSVREGGEGGREEGGREEGGEGER